MNKEKKLYSYHILSFAFNEDIEKVYQAFFTDDTFKKAGLIKNIVQAKNYNEQLGSYKFYFCKPKLCIIDAVDALSPINEPNFKSISIKISSLNGQQMTSNITTMYNFYVNTASYHI